MFLGHLFVGFFMGDEDVVKEGNRGRKCGKASTEVNKHWPCPNCLIDAFPMLLPFLVVVEMPGKVAASRKTKTNWLFTFWGRFCALPQNGTRTEVRRTETAAIARVVG